MAMAVQQCIMTLINLLNFEKEELHVQVIENLCKKICKQWMILYPWINDPNFLPDNKKLTLK